MMSITRALALALVLVATIAVTLPATGDPGPEPALLTDPYLQNPTRSGVRVAWVTEFEGDRHVVLVGRRAGELDDATLNRVARGRSQGGSGFRVVPARTIELSRTREDQSSQVPGRTYSSIERRPLWRHEARVTGIAPGRRMPYRVLSIDGDTWVSSETFSLSALPRPDDDANILLTSDHQLMRMTPANLQKVEETVGRVDAVFLAGDLVNIPDRASEWFDDARGRAFFPGLQGNAAQVIDSPDGASTTYRGGELIQHAPLFPVIGNHEVMGRTAGATLGEQFNTPVPVEVAERNYERVAEEVNPSGDPAVRRQWIEDDSFNSDTYEELFTLPTSRKGGEKYWSKTIGNVRLVGLYVTQIWRSPSTTADARTKYREPIGALDDELEQGWGQHIFEPIAKGSEQYEWLKRELRSPAFRRAEHKVVMFHHPAHTLGDNISPPFTDPIRIEERGPSGELLFVRYEYPKADDYIIRDVEPLLEDAGANLVFNGHSHLWNRFQGPTGVNYIETSNVGNSYGAYTEQTGRARPVPPPPWNPDNYTAQGDPNGLEPIMPTVNPLLDPSGRPEPYVQSNDITVFSVLATGTGEVVSYGFDTRKPDSDVFVLDRFPLDG